MRRLTVRYGTPKGTKLVVRGAIDDDLGPRLPEGADFTTLLVGDGTLFLSAHVPGSLLQPNSRATAYKMRSDGGTTDGLTRVRLNRTVTGPWKITAAGEWPTRGLGERVGLHVGRHDVHTLTREACAEYRAHPRRRMRAG